MKKLFVCDFDGTLYKKNNNRLTKAILDEIKILKSKGHEFIIATGRPLHLLEPFFDNFKDMLFISNDGALFSKGFEIIHSFPVDKELIKKNFCDYKGSFLTYGQCITYAKVKEKALKFKLNDFYRGHITEIGCVSEISEDIYKVSFLGKEPKTDFLDKCWCSYGINEYVAKGVSKGNCLSYVMNSLGYEKENTVVFGDGYNDISMMKYAKSSYAMMSAPPKVKANASGICENVLDILRGEM